MLRETRTSTRAGEATVRSLVRHPSEHVRFVLASVHAPYLRRTAPHLLEEMGGRAQQDAHRAGWLWTVLVDALAVAGCPIPIPPALAQWVEQERDPARLDGLLLFRHVDLRLLAARTSPAIEAPQASQLWQTEECRSALFENAHVEDAVRERLLRRILAERHVGTAPPGTAILLMRIAHSSRGFPPGIREILRGRVQARESLGPEGIAAEPVSLLVSDRGTSAEEILELWPRMHPSLRERCLLRAEVRALPVLRRILSGSDARDLLRYLVETGAQLPLEPEVAAYLVEHPRMDDSIARAVASLPVAHSPEVLAAVQRTVSPVIAEAFIGQSAREDFPRLFRILARERPSAALDALEVKPAGAAVTAVDLAPILSLGDSPLGIRAFSALHRAFAPPAARSR
jgi:hypothetical protein